jgi:hypothetical protein
MSTQQQLIEMPVRSRVRRVKAVASQVIQSLSGTARDALLAYAMTGSAIASLAIIAAPHLEMLLHCILDGRA